MTYPKWSHPSSDSHHQRRRHRHPRSPEDQLRKRRQLSVYLYSPTGKKNGMSSFHVDLLEFSVASFSRLMGMTLQCANGKTSSKIKPKVPNTQPSRMVRRVLIGSKASLSCCSTTIAQETSGVCGRATPTATAYPCSSVVDSLLVALFGFEFWVLRTSSTAGYWRSRNASAYLPDPKLR